MNPQLFTFALTKARSSDWEHFEELASRFLVSEFPELRTMANPSGDGGRDSELFSPGGTSTVALQYSVAKDWKSKINRTLTRIEETLPDVRVLIYLTNQKIGASGDSLKRDYYTKGVILDIRDFSWLSERMQTDDNRYAAASAFVDVIARPILEGQKVIEKNRPALTNLESKAALTYLAMQWEDEKTEKGLSKVVYEALILSALRNTGQEHRMSRSEIHQAICGYLASSKEAEVLAQVDLALRRLTKKKIRHWQGEDGFCLTNDEVVRLQGRLVETELEESDFLKQVERLVEAELQPLPDDNEIVLQDYRDRVVRVLDSFLLKTGEAFAASVASGEIGAIDRDLLYNVVYDDISSHKCEHCDVAQFPDVALNVIARLSSSANINVRAHLRKVADSYTLFAFLRETPDVQKATKKIFGHGKIWLDTTIVLPLLAESFNPDENAGRYTTAISNLGIAGVELRITDGVVQELLHHIDVSRACSTRAAAEWIGRIPYLYSKYIESGYAPSTFASTAERFRGFLRPEDDIAEYLVEHHGINVESLAEKAETADESLRFATERLWTEAHQARRNGGNDGDELGDATEILIRNDVQSYLGILVLRQSEPVTELGYKHWWLTKDSVAWKIRRKLREEFDGRAASPLMSLDFLLNWLSFGPSRSKLDRTHEQLLPVLLDIDFSAHLPEELLALAEKVRLENSGASDYLIKRKIRDACDQLRGKYGRLTRAERS